jgi:hypothetical protein
MDQESFIQNTQQYQSKYKGSDTVGAFLAFSPDYVVDTAMMGNFIALPPLSSTAGQSPAWPRGGRVGNQGFVISRTSKHRDVLIRLYDYLNSDLEIALTWNRGPKNVTWRMRGDGKWEIAAENQPKDMAYGVWRNSSAPGSQSPVFMKSAWVGPEKQHFSTSRDKLKVSSVSAYLPYLEKEYIPNNIIPADDASTRNLLWVEIESYLQRFAAQAVMQGINDAGWAAHLATLKQLKADEYTAITQKYYRPVK